MKIEEIRIPAPWGHIAAKLWGDETNEAVLCWHGFQDNAATFDRLIPHLPQHFFYICVDLPGHGRSSQFHRIMPVHFYNYLLPFTIIADHFKRKKYILLAHSFGGELSMMFAQLFPKLVSKMVLIDVIYVEPFEPELYSSMVISAHDYFFKEAEGKSKNRPSYAYEEIVDKVLNNRYNGVLTRETAEDLVKRMIEPANDGKYFITIDPKVKRIVYPGATSEFNLQLCKARPVECPVLMLLAPYNQYSIKNEQLVGYFKEVGFYIKWFDGDHCSHQTNPGLIKDDITDFLNNRYSKL